MPTINKNSIAAENLMAAVQQIRRNVRGRLILPSVGQAELAALRVQAESLSRRHGASDYGHQFDNLAADLEAWLAREQSK